MADDNQNPLTRLFEPKVVALIGSSRLIEAVGIMNPRTYDSIYHNLTKFFEGEVVTLDIGTDPGKLKETKVKADLAVIVLSAALSNKALEFCGKNGVKAAIVIPGGFKDADRASLRETAFKNGIRVLGPNAIMGVINTRNGLNTTFERDLMPKRGGLSVLSQSGGVGAALADLAIYYGEGISKFIWLGDKADISEAELLDYLAEDKESRVILLYLESIKDGQEFLRIVKKVTRNKPVVILKGGISEEAKARALSHTAAISIGSDRIFRAAAKQNGAIIVESTEELLIAGEALEKQPPMRGKQLFIVSNVGGPAVLAADAAHQSGFKLARLSEEAVKRFESRYPGVEAINPLDIIADARADRFKDAMESVLQEDGVDGVLVINMLKSCLTLPEDVKIIAQVANEYPDKPVVDCAPGGEDYHKIRGALDGTKIPVFSAPEKAVFAIKMLNDYGEYLSSTNKKQS